MKDFGHVARGKCRHMFFDLTCDEYEGLAARSDLHCEICRAPLLNDWRDQHHIDHDHARPAFAVRGLLCSRCNVLLDRHPDRLDSDGVHWYLAQPPTYGSWTKEMQAAIVRVKVLVRRRPPDHPQLVERIEKAVELGAGPRTIQLALENGI